jgi:hypothetical protein
VDYLGVNFGYLFVILLNLLLVGGWLVSAIFALIQLRRQYLPETARAIWAALILLVPLAGALAFWIVQPGKRPPEAGRRD